MSRWISKLIVPALVFYWLALFVATHSPRLSIPLHVSMVDKLAHFSAYACLAFLTTLTWRVFRPVTDVTYRMVFLLLAGYGAIDELSQIPIPGRKGDWFDWFADLLGIAAGLVAFAVVRRLFRRRAAAKPPVDSPSAEACSTR